MKTRHSLPGRPLSRIVTSLSIALLSCAPAISRAASEAISDSVKAEIGALIAEKETRTPAQKKMDSQLVYLAKQSRKEVIAAAAPNLVADVKADGQGRVLVDINASVSAGLLDAVIRSGGSVVNHFAAFDAVRALVPVGTVETLAAREDVRSIGPAALAITNVGSILSQGDRTHRADTARTTTGATGNEIKIGVLSDGVGSLAASKANGNLNALATVLPGQAGSGNEGTAMMEIIQDLVPDAQIIFATAFNGNASFAANILALQAAGCTIIVDDVSYFNESPFQDQVIAQAVSTVSAAGVLYFSSAGNSGNKNDGTSGTWEGDFVSGGAVAAPVTGTGNLLDFDTTAGVTTFNTVGAGGSSRRVDLFWADPDLASNNDYDLFVLNSAGTSVLRSSTNLQTGTQSPYESTGTLNAGERIVVVQRTGAANRFLQLTTGRAQLTFTTNGVVRGHNASGAANAFCVAATNVANSPSPSFFVGGATNPVETFSSDGPRRIFFQPNGTAITPGDFSSTGGTVLNKPDITAADGGNTSAPGFLTFFGTSAAAPHAAAIAALIKSYNPALTPAQIRTALTTTALDIEAAGNDRDSGAGIVMALAAIQSVAPPANAILSGPPQLESVGVLGGPFTPAAATYTITNPGAVPINWTAAKTQPWTTLSSTGGTLAAGSSVTVTCSFNATANALILGSYSEVVTIADTTSSFSRSFNIDLTVQEQLNIPVTVLPTDGATSPNARAPITAFRFERSVYLIKATELAASGFAAGATPTSIGWVYSAAPGITGAAPLKVYFENTADATNLKSTTWSTAITGMTKVHDSTTPLPNAIGPFDISLTGGSPFTYTGGALYVAFDWGDYTGTASSTVVVSCNNTGLAGGILGAQGTSAPTTLTSSNFRPETRLGTTTTTKFAVTPLDGLTSIGRLGGPFTPASASYVLRNDEAFSVNWTAANTQSWLTLSPASGSLAPGASVTVTATVNAAANTLPMGTYADTVTFNNSTTGLTFTRPVSLSAGIDYFTEFFPSANDTDNQSWLFIPDGSANFYRVGRTQGVAAFPTDPTGGTSVTMSDDTFVQATLSGGQQVQLYGVSYPSFFISSNGYVTFGSGDADYDETLTNHFNLPRIVALFDDLLPTTGQVTWKQTADRVAVTWQGVSEFTPANSNSFQIEMFFDGRIRITCLAIAASDGLIGLSRGLGLPFNFSMSDFSTYPLGSPDIAVAQASSLTDGVDTVAFGTVTAGSSSAAKTFTITNPGTSDLTSLAVTKDGTDPAEFTISALSGTSIPVGTGTATFTIAFTPAPGSSGAKTASIHIASNVAGAKNPFDFTVTGDAAAVSTPSPVLFTVSGSPSSATSGSSATDGTGAADGTQFDQLQRSGYLAENGTLAFLSYLKMGVGGVDATNFMGYWKQDSGSSTLLRLARMGENAPETGATAAKFNILPLIPGINDGGQVTLFASLLQSGLSTPPTTADNDIGLWSELGGTGFQILIREDDTIPGLGGPKVDSLGWGCFATAKTGTSTGEAAFVVGMKGGSTDTALLRTSVVNSDTTQVGVIARENTTAPGAGENFAGLNNTVSRSVRMDAAGNVVFAAGLLSGKVGIWYQDQATKTVAKSIFTGDAAGGTTTTFQQLDLPDMGGGGTFAFRGVLNTTGDNAANDKNDGIWKATGTGTPALILRRGDSNTNRAGLFTGAILTANPNIKAGNIYNGWLTNANHGAWLGWVDLAGDGISAFPADTFGIYTDASGTMTLLTASGQPAPGIAGANFFFIDHPVCGGAEQVAFIGTVTGGGVTAGTNDKGVWRTASNGGAVSLVLRTGDSMILTVNGVTTTKTISDLDIPGSGYAEHIWETPVMDATGRLLIFVTFTDNSTTQVIVP